MTSDEKRQQILQLAKTELSNALKELPEASRPTERQIEHILKAAIEITDAGVELPDGFPELETRFEATRIKTGLIGPEPTISWQPGRILFDWKKLTAVVSDVVLTGGTIYSANHYFWPLLFGKIIADVHSKSKEQIGEVEATILCALFEVNGHGRYIPEDQIFEYTNKLRAKFDKKVITQKEFIASVNRLKTIKCLDIQHGKLKLIEKVKVTYN
jgi:hypothetical protein